MTQESVFFVPVPHVVLDVIMPTLRDTEFRVLMVVLRQTLGWYGKGPGAAKAADWLTHSQLRERTGRASEAVSAAIDVLVRRRLIDVVDGNGRIAATPESRRANQSRLYYRLGSAVPLPDTYPPVFSSADDVIRKSEIGKAKTTIMHRNISCRFRKSGSAGTKAIRRQGGPSTIELLTPEQMARIEQEKAKIREKLSGLSKSR